MKKDINFYGFFSLYRLLREKFPEYNFETDWYCGGIFKMFSGSKNFKNGEIYLRIENPMPYEPNEKDFEDFDIKKKTIEIEFYVDDVVTFLCEIKKEAFFSRIFIRQLKKVIGEYPSLRIDDENFNEKVLVWSRELIFSRLSSFVTLIDENYW